MNPVPEVFRYPVESKPDAHQDQDRMNQKILTRTGQNNANTVLKGITSYSLCTRYFTNPNAPCLHIFHHLNDTFFMLPTRKEMLPRAFLIP